MHLMRRMSSTSAAQLRKIKKPMIERRRRERINDCLNQLKSIVLKATDKDELQYSKMEKADILEMTVDYLRTTRRRCKSSLSSISSAAADSTDHRLPSVATDPDTNLALPRHKDTDRWRYTSGYAECATLVQRYLAANAPIIGADVADTTSSLGERLVQHLVTSAAMCAVCREQTGSRATRIACDRCSEPEIISPPSISQIGFQPQASFGAAFGPSIFSDIAMTAAMFRSCVKRSPILCPHVNSLHQQIGVSDLNCEPDDSNNNYNTNYNSYNSKILDESYDIRSTNCKRSECDDVFRILPDDEAGDNTIPSLHEQRDDSVDMCSIWRPWPVAPGNS